MTDRELLQQALEQLDRVAGAMPFPVSTQIRSALRDRLALSYVPKVWMQCPECGKKSPMPDPDAREWVGMTDDEIAIICGECAASAHRADDISFARAIEAHLRKKNT